MEEKENIQSFKMSKPKGNILIQLISLILTIGVVMLALMAIPVLMMAGYAGVLFGWIIIAVWIGIIITSAISVSLIARLKIKGIYIFTIVSAIFIIVYFLIPEFRRSINFETLWLPSSLILINVTLWLSRKQFS